MFTAFQILIIMELLFPKIKVIAANEFENNFCIIIGGKSLLMWHFDWPVQRVPEQEETSHSNDGTDSIEIVSVESPAIASVQEGSTTTAESFSSLLPSTLQISLSGYHLHCTICKITAEQKPEIVFMHHFTNYLHYLSHRKIH